MDPRASFPSAAQLYMTRSIHGLRAKGTEHPVLSRAQVMAGSSLDLNGPFGRGNCEDD